jgi:PQQ-dependent catabolism-associated CXXCW motif protein
MAARAAAALAALLLLPGLAAAGPVAEPDAYRMEEFRAPVPESVVGATVVDAEGAAALWRAGAAFLDVLPRPEKPEGLPPGTLWRDRPRDSIPGAIWAPNTGYGRLSPGADAYLRAAFAAAKAGDPDRPVVVFCDAGCWMSWNVARRAVLEYGLTGIHWFPDGMDGWRFEDLPTARVEPLPRP